MAFSSFEPDVLMSLDPDGRPQCPCLHFFAQGVARRHSLSIAAFDLPGATQPKLLHSMPDGGFSVSSVVASSSGTVNDGAIASFEGLSFFL